jgi:hypothetical protein
VQSNDLSLAGTYTITVSAKSPALAVLSPTLSFQLVLVNPCLAATFTIDPSIIAASTTYTLADPQFSFTTLDYSKITANDVLATCPALQLDILTSADAVIDSAVFNFATEILKVYSTDSTKIKTYNMRLKVKYIGAIYSYEGSLSF